MSEDLQIVSDEWNTYPAHRDGVFMFISFDEIITSDDLPSDLQLCARVMIPIHTPNEAGGPVSAEAELLWEMEDGLVELLQEHKVNCRLVGRLTYDGLREIVFQLHDWESFRGPVGLWIMQHEQYEIDVSEHDGWDFVQECICPRLEDHLYMADRQVVDLLLESGSDPEKEHSLEFVFTGSSEGLKQVADTLQQRGYLPVEEGDANSDQLVMAKPLVLDLNLIVNESLENHELAESMGVEFDGWGAAVVS